MCVCVGIVERHCNSTSTYYAHKYAEEKISMLDAQGKLTRRFRFTTWTAITITELLGFIAIILIMGSFMFQKWRTTGRFHGCARFHFLAAFFVVIDLNSSFGCCMLVTQCLREGGT